MIAATLLALATSQAATLPQDVRAYIVRREQCDHFRGEGSPEDARQEEIEAAAIRLCKGSDAQLARLKRLHARKPAVRRALAAFDPKIED